MAGRSGPKNFPVYALSISSRPAPPAHTQQGPSERPPHLHPIKGKIDMDIRQHQESWNQFPEISMEERPLLSSDLDKMTMHNPFTGVFYLRNKLLARIVAGACLWIFTIFQLRASWLTDGPDLRSAGAGPAAPDLFYLFSCQAPAPLCRLPYPGRSPADPLSR